MYKNLLPIGSVVLLKDTQKRVMIIGRIQSRGDDDKIYDYSACLYPEGIMGNGDMYFFDRDDIEAVFFIGFQDPEGLQYQREILDQLGELEIKDGKIMPKE